MKRSVAALGNFDGVHLGHQRILKDAASFAKRKKLRSLAITFDPHPQQFIAPERGLKLLTTLAERKELMLDQGIEEIKVIRFDGKLRKLGYQEFVNRYIVKKLKAAYVFVGYDFNFGRGREGGVGHLRNLGKEHGFAVKVIRPVKEKQHLVKSSTIRKLIAQGDFNHAITLLGHPYRLTGKVVHGTHRGRDLGIHTANLKLDEHKLIPQHGVYIGKAGNRKCVVNIGARPTFGMDGVAVEAHILNFSGNLYGKILKVDLYRRLRDEIQFPDVELLKSQIAKDIAICRRAVL